MNTRPRVLVVEDDDVLRNTWLDLLNEEGGFSARGAASAAEAICASGRCFYHVALIDIVLDAHDASNRDGVEVVRHLRRLDEGTQPLVLSGQASRALVRDLLREYGAVDYIVKDEVEEKGNTFLIERVRSAATAIQTPSKAALWESLAKTFSGGVSEEAFVYEFLRTLGFKGGYDNLSTSLLAACKPLVPLLPEAGARPGLRREEGGDIFSGRFWSKGQCSAVEILIHGPNAPTELFESKWNLSARDTLHKRTKGGLTIVVLECPELDRDQFLPLPA